MGSFQSRILNSENYMSAAEKPVSPVANDPSNDFIIGYFHQYFLTDRYISYVIYVREYRDFTVLVTIDADADR